MKFDLIEFIFLLIGSGFIFTKIPQIKKLIERKTSNDISLAQWSFDAILLVPWIWYALYRAKSVAMTVNYTALTIANFIVVYLVYKYKGK